MEFNIPIPGNIVVVHVGDQAFHVGLYPPDPPTSPTISEHESDDAGPEPRLHCQSLSQYEHRICY